MFSTLKLWQQEAPFHAEPGVQSAEFNQRLLTPAAASGKKDVLTHLLAGPLSILFVVCPDPLRASPLRAAPSFTFAPGAIF